MKLRVLGRHQAIAELTGSIHHSQEPPGLKTVQQSTITVAMGLQNIDPNWDQGYEKPASLDIEHGELRQLNWKFGGEMGSQP